jgi:ketosteroid isomerase-like protein
VAQSQDEITAVVSGFFEALGSGDLATCDALMADDALVWHNYDQAEQPKAEALGALGFLTLLTPEFRITKRDFLADGCVQQHVAVIAFPDGVTFEVPAIQRIYVDSGRITRVEEYMDSAAMGAVMGKAQSLLADEG